MSQKNISQAQAAAHNLQLHLQTLDLVTRLYSQVKDNDTKLHDLTVASLENLLQPFLPVSPIATA